MITTIELQTLKELILKTEPDFMAQIELSVNGFGKINNLTQNETVWIWSKEKIRALSETDLIYVISKITEQ